jgi:hypothetical protein
MVGQSHILTDEKEEQAALWARVVLCGRLVQDSHLLDEVV